jgi:uncharacterized protein YhbP (UPF0306 family)
MSLDSTKEHIKQFLANHTTLTLATVSTDGCPQAAPLFFAETDELSLIFISEQKVRHSKNIAAKNTIAAAIYTDGQQWQSIRGLQIEGTCSALSGQAAKAARDIYLQKFPFIKKNKLLLIMLNTVTFYQIIPTWVRLIDNSRGFGHKEEIRLSFQAED